MQVPSCCNDPIVWKAGGAWYAVTANHGSGKGDGDYGYESFYTSLSLLGPKANWTSIGTPFFTNKASQLVPGHPQVHKKKSGNIFRVGIFLDSVWPPARTPHDRIDPHGGEIERLAARTRRSTSLSAPTTSWTSRAQVCVPRRSTPPHGGQSDFVRLSARTPHGGASYVW